MQQKHDENENSRNTFLFCFSVVGYIRACCNTFFRINSPPSIVASYVDVHVCKCVLLVCEVSHDLVYPRRLKLDIGGRVIYDSLHNV